MGLIYVSIPLTYMLTLYKFVMNQIVKFNLKKKTNEKLKKSRNYLYSFNNNIIIIIKNWIGVFSIYNCKGKLDDL
jgi:hypothetical protein